MEFDVRIAAYFASAGGKAPIGSSCLLRGGLAAFSLNSVFLG